MRNAWCSLNTAPTTRLISCALARSLPSGFSSTTRTCGWFKPAWPSCSQMAVKRCGAVARYSTTVSARRLSSQSFSPA